MHSKQYSRPFTTNFSPFFPVSGGLVTSAGLGLSFSGASFAAQRNPSPQKTVKGMAIRIRMNLLNFSLIGPPKIKSYNKIYLYISPKFNPNLIFKDFD
jgi:hypothetical protein